MVNKEYRDGYPIVVSALYRSSGRLYARESEARLLECLVLSPAHHGLASEATLHAWRPHFGYRLLAIGYSRSDMPGM